VIARRLGVKVNGWAAPDTVEFAGINSREELAQMEAQIRERVNRRLMKAGVILLDPATAYIGPEVESAIEFYEDAARRYGLQLADVGSLRFLGHISGSPLQDDMMLKISLALTWCRSPWPPKPWQRGFLNSHH